jgi:copper chaperone NosL
MRRGIPVLFFLFLILCCKNDSEIKPTDVFYGQDVCEKCKMIISEKVFSAQYILPRGQAKKFDDIGCMIHYLLEEETNKDKVLAIFVREYNSKEWIDGEKAYYVWSKKIKTPMGHGLVALKEKEAAEEISETKEGLVFKDFNETANWILKHEHR